MAITGTDKTIDTQTLRDDLSKRMNSDDFLNAVGYHGGITLLPAQVAGIKPGFREKLEQAIDAYLGSVNMKLNELETNPNIAQAFKGEGVDAAIRNLITAVKQEAKAYTDQLRSVEQSIIQQVDLLYSDQANSVSDSMRVDTSRLGH